MAAGLGQLNSKLSLQGVQGACCIEKLDWLDWCATATYAPGGTAG